MGLPGLTGSPAAPPVLRTATHPKRYRLGTHRVRPPEETWAWIAPLLPRFGITRTADVTGLDALGIPVCQAVRPASRNISVSQGKGVSAAAARVSAAMEAVELWHAEDLAHLPQVEATLAEMEASNPIAPGDLPWLDGAPHLPGWRQPWVRAELLVTGGQPGGQSGWLPRRMLELDFTLPSSFTPQLFHRTSNGLASGNCREEALVHALCELVERHALHRVRGGDRSKRPLDPASVPEGFLRGLLDRFRREGMKLALWDLTWEVEVPVVSVDAAAPDLPRVWFGSGCHPDPAVALSRALTEAAQARLTFIAGARDDLTYPGEAGSGEGPDEPFAAYEGFEEPSGGAAFATLPDVSSQDVEEDLERLVTALAATGWEPYAVDLTREDVGIPVVRAFVPGLPEAFHA